MIFVCKLPINKIKALGLFVFDTVFIRTIIWLTLLGLSDHGPDKVSIENKMPFILYIYRTCQVTDFRSIGASNI